MRVPAIIFDCDGVLADSEGASAEAWTTTLAKSGYQLTTEEFRRFIGTTDRELADTFASALDTTAEFLLKLAEAEMRRVLANGLEPFPDAIRLLDRVDGHPVAVASNSERWRLDCVLASAGLSGRFAVSVASDEVTAPKPDPAVYLRAAALLGVAPSECVVIEDSPTGIASARRARMRVVAVDRGHFPRSEIGDADWVV
ncbi:MAG TPA: HAD family phosphatase, partial [Acidimicrobiia bacterium]|nr:HAD family phosphatase [Acidimicrobiia bacterium]